MSSEKKDDDRDLRLQKNWGTAALVAQGFSCTVLAAAAAGPLVAAGTAYGVWRFVRWFRSS